MDILDNGWNKPYFEQKNEIISQKMFSKFKNEI